MSKKNGSSWWNIASQVNKQNKSKNPIPPIHPVHNSCDTEIDEIIINASIDNYSSHLFFTHTSSTILILFHLFQNRAKTIDKINLQKEKKTFKLFSFTLIIHMNEIVINYIS